MAFIWKKAEKAPVLMTHKQEDINMYWFYVQRQNILLPSWVDYSADTNQEISYFKKIKMMDDDCNKEIYRVSCKQRERVKEKLQNK